MRIPFRQMKIYEKLLIYFMTVCIIPLIITGTIIYEISVKNIEEGYMELASIFNSQVVTMLNDFVEEYDRATKSILVDFDLIDSLSQENEDALEKRLEQKLKMRRVMMRLLTLKPEIKSITLVTLNGTVHQLGSNGKTIDGAILKNQDWLVDFKKSQDILAVTSVHDRAYYDEEQDGLVITVCRRILDYSGAYVGDLLLDVEPGSLITLNDVFLITRNQYNIKIRITNKNNGVLFDSDVASGRLTWKAVLEDENKLLYERNERDYIVMANDTEGGELKVFIVIPKSELLMKIDRVKHITYIIIISSASLVMLISAIISMKLSQPIRKLQGVMGKIEEGIYEEFYHEDSYYEINTLIACYNHMVGTIKDLIEKVYVVEIKQKNAKLLALQTQINPHMLYNTLEAIRMKAIVNDEDEIADMIKSMAHMFRLILETEPSSYRVENDIEYVELFVGLQNIRLPEVFSLEIHMNELIRKAEIFPLILQPLVENSIEHGYRGGNQPLHMILIGEMVEDRDIIIRLEDDGKGMSEERVQQINAYILNVGKENNSLTIDREKLDSIGLINIAERIALYYGEQYYIQIVKSNENGTIVEIKIPWKRNV